MRTFTMIAALAASTALSACGQEPEPVETDTGFDHATANSIMGQRASNPIQRHTAEVVDLFTEGGVDNPTNAMMRECGAHWTSARRSEPSDCDELAEDLVLVLEDAGYDGVTTDHVKRTALWTAYNARHDELEGSEANSGFSDPSVTESMFGRRSRDDGR